MKLARLPKLWRLIRITKIIKFIRVALSFLFIALFASSILYQHFSSSDIFDFFEFNAGVTRLINLFATLFLAVHLFACFWNYMALLDSSNTENWI